jgi:ribosome-associated translation inhibitor RaiA
LATTIEKLEKLKLIIQGLKKDKNEFSNLYESRKEYGSSGNNIISALLSERGTVNIDFDQTIVKSHYQSGVARAFNVTASEADVRDENILELAKSQKLVGEDCKKLTINTPEILSIMEKLALLNNNIQGGINKVNELLEDPKTSIVNTELFKQLIEQAQDSGLMVSVASFSDVSTYVFYPTMQKIGLSEERIARIHPEMWMPDNPNAQDANKNEHIKKILQHFGMEDMPKKNHCLIDDREVNVEAANKIGYTGIQRSGFDTEVFIKKAIKFVEERGEAINKAIEKALKEIDAQIVKEKKRAKIINSVVSKITNFIGAALSVIFTCFISSKIFNNKDKDNVPYALLLTPTLGVGIYNTYRLMTRDKISFRKETAQNRVQGEINR